MFVVPVPKGFTPEQRLTWTLVANGQTTSIPLRLHPDYLLSPFEDSAVKNTPPILRFTQSGPAIQGPIGVLDKADVRTTSPAMPLDLTLWVTDDAKYTKRDEVRRRGARGRRSRSCMVEVSRRGRRHL